MNYNDKEALILQQIKNLRNLMKEIKLSQEKNGKESVAINKKKLYFTLTKKETNEMPEQFKKIFIANNYIVNYRITPHGYYEARIRRKDLYVEASARDFETMRKRFLIRLQDCLESHYVSNQNSSKRVSKRQISFGEFVEEWLKIKEKTTKPSTFKEYKRTYEVDIKPKFGKLSLQSITRTMLQNFLLEIWNEEKYRKAEKVQLMLKCVFDVASDDYDMKSPMKNVVLPYRVTQKGHAFTKDEEQRLVNYCLHNKDVDGVDALIVLLYFGLRKSELASIRVIDNKWLECETSKERLGQNVVLRKIPFTPMAKKVVDKIDFVKAKNANVNTVYNRLKKLFPNHHPHELRYTFITRLKECGVNPELVMLWDGHSEDKDVISSRVDRGYTDYSEEYQLKEAEKVVY